MEGWIKLHRKIAQHWIYKNSDYVKAWICILITVNYEDKKVLIHGELIECKRSQSLLSLLSWAKLFGKNWTIQKVRTFFELLKSDSMIITEGLPKTTRLTVCNYDDYQTEQQTDNTQITFKQQTDNTQITTTKEVKEVKKIKNVFIKPSVEEIKQYCIERKNGINFQKFFDSNEAKGWVIGKTKTPMKDWRAAIRTWEGNNDSTYSPKQEERKFTPQTKW